MCNTRQYRNVVKHSQIEKTVAAIRTLKMSHTLATIAFVSESTVTPSAKSNTTRYTAPTSMEEQASLLMHTNSE